MGGGCGVRGVSVRVGHGGKCEGGEGGEGGGGGEGAEGGGGWRGWSCWAAIEHYFLFSFL